MIAEDILLAALLAAVPADREKLIAEEMGVDRLAAWTYRGGYGTVVGAPDALKLWDTIGESYKRVCKK